MRARVDLARRRRADFLSMVLVSTGSGSAGGGPARGRGRPRYAFLASLRVMGASEYFTPLPLYGSGGRNPRIVAAPGATGCLPAPDAATPVRARVALG